MNPVSKPKRRQTQSQTRSQEGHSLPPIDYGPLDARVGYHLRRAQIAVFADFYTCFEGVDIRPVQYSILTIIEYNPGLLQTQVSEALGIRKPNFVALIVDLEKRGYVERIQQESDRRSYGLYLTKNGKSFMTRLHALALAHEDRVIGTLGPKKTKELFAMLKAIASKGLDKRDG